MRFPLAIPLSLAIALIKATIKNRKKKQAVKAVLLELAAIITAEYEND